MTPQYTILSTTTATKALEYEPLIPPSSHYGQLQKKIPPPSIFLSKLIKNNIPACVYEFQADFSL